MKRKLVKRTVDLARLPALSDEQKAELTALGARPESDINYSDIGPLAEEFWRNAAKGRLYKPTKTSTTVRIDSDVLAWLRGQGDGYQTRINAILRREMLQAMRGQGPQ